MVGKELGPIQLAVHDVRETGVILFVSDPSKNSGSAPGPSVGIGETANPNSQGNSRH